MRSATAAPVPTANGPSVVVASRSTASRIVHALSPHVSPTDFMASLATISQLVGQSEGARSNPSHPDHGKAFASDVALQVAGDLFARIGVSAIDERPDLSRHWRNARTYASDDPVH